MADFTVGYNSAGVAGDYTTIAAAISALSDGDNIKLLYSTATQGMRFHEAPAFSKRIGMQADSSISHFPVIRSATFTFQPSGTTVYEGFKFARAASSQATITLTSGGSGQVIFRRLIAYCGRINPRDAGGGSILFENCLIEASEAYGIQAEGAAVPNTTVQNCTVYGSFSGGVQNCICVNTLVVGPSGVCFSANQTGSDYNSSSDATANIGANSVINNKFEDIDFYSCAVGGCLYRPKPISNVVGAGTTTGQPSTDIYGNSYGGTGTIGCFAGIVLSNDADSILDSVSGGNWTDVAESNVLDGVQWGVGGTSREGTAVGPPLDFDNIHWEEDANLDLQPLESPLDRNYPAEAEVEFGVVYGATNDFTGTLVVTGGGPRPTTPTLRIINNQDDTATATISGSDAGTTNTVWIFLRHGGVLELIDAGSRVGDGDVTISNPNGEYIGYVVSELNDILSLPSNPDGFWVTSDRQYLIRTSAAEAELQATRLSQYGHQVTFQNGNTATPITVWATIESGRETIQLRNTTRTDLSDFVFHIPRQTGFPPADFAVGATITYDGKEWEIDIVEPSNGLLSASSSFRCVCGRYRSAGNF